MPIGGGAITFGEQYMDESFVLGSLLVEDGARDRSAACCHAGSVSRWTSSDPRSL
jgi:hypothetical protein